MKMDWTHEELFALAENGEELLINKLEALITEHEGALTLEHMKAAKNEVFFSSYREFVQDIEEGGFSYDFEQIGRFSNYLYDRLETVWLEYVR